jgi:hypothetical protein
MQIAHRLAHIVLNLIMYVYNAWQIENVGVTPNATKFAMTGFALMKEN